MAQETAGSIGCEAGEARSQGDPDPPAVVAERAIQRIGDPSGVEAMFDEHAPAVFAFAARRVGRELAQDVTADTFRVAIESTASFDGERGTARAWLLGIAANHVRRYWRTEQRRLAAMSRMPADHVVDDLQSTSAHRLDATRQLPRLLAAVAALPPDDRDLLTLVAWERMPYREVAVALGIPVGTVASRLNRIRSLLASGDDDAN